ncbi:hypothetical protein HDV00_009399 [Rhizophlyctis rosea]|nr:hypothetical protein HDV00_009399 [Rhizophlyctis rosea]
MSWNSAPKSFCSNCCINIATQDAKYIPKTPAPPPNLLPNTAYAAANLDARPKGEWPCYHAVGEVPILCPTDTTKVLVCTPCNDLYLSGGNQGDVKLICKRSVRRSMFSRIPDELYLELPERIALRKKDLPKSKVKKNDKELEGKLFPWIYPKGTGYWVEGKGATARSFEEDMEIKLNSFDSRWRDDDEWAGWAAARVKGEDGIDALYPEAE